MQQKYNALKKNLKNLYEKGEDVREFAKSFQYDLAY